MSGLRLTVQVTPDDARAAVEAGKLAEMRGIDSIWVGGTAGPGSDSAKVTMTLAALAAVTDHIRLGAVLGPVASEHVMFVAEELGVVDQASGGRLELILPSDDQDGFVQQADAIRRAWAGVRLEDGRVVGATPTPVQPQVPTTVLASEPGVAEGSGSRCVPIEVARELPEAARFYDTRTALLMPESPDWFEAPHEDSAKAVVDLVRELEHCRATEVVFPIDVGSASYREKLGFLAAIVHPALGASSYEVDLVVADALSWYDRSADSSFELAPLS